MRNYFWLYLLFAFSALAGCSDDDPIVNNGQHEEEQPPETGTGTETGSSVLKLTSFNFNKSLNPQLTEDIRGIIDDDKITVLLPETTPSNIDLNLIPSFVGIYETVKVGSVIQTSGLTVQNFNQTITYILTSSKGTVKNYEVTVKIFTGIPIVWIETENKATIASKDDYVNGTVTVSQTPPFTESYQGTMRIKGRGNATWSYPKKPYRIKLDSKSKILGMPSDKDWVLLAEYCDKSLLRSTYAFELSKLMELSWTPRGYHVEVFLNGSYNGTYFLGEHVKVASNRVNIGDDGYLIENDNYWNQEPIWFTTGRGLHFTFKQPDPEEMVEGDDNYNFILNYMNEFESVLFSDNFTDPNNGYRKYIDVQSFAKWFLLQETLGNAEPNPYYVLPTRTGKLEMYPPWDFEWSMGLAYMENNTWILPPATSPVAHFYHKNKTYFSRLFQDPYFVNIVKQEWVKVKGLLPALTTIMDEKTANIRYAQIKNFSRWPILGQYISVGLVKFNTWQEEVDYAKKFLNDRAEWMDSEFGN
ncbi:MAG: CotH kinase family protein [Dysgonamonadaceae bacterium]|nr:CotH kinase family protein [Dysgonamonadaceae bacterium]